MKIKYVVAVGFIIFIASCSQLEILDTLVIRVMSNSVIYVDASAPLGGDGNSWESAYKHLQNALDDTFYDIVDIGWPRVIHVAEGIYYPTDGEGIDEITEFGGEMPPSFRILPHVQLIGGYPAGGGTRDPDTYVSVLSCDIGSNDETDLNSITQHYNQINGTNLEVLIYFGMMHEGCSANDIGRDTLMDGFTITGGGNTSDYEGAVVSSGGSPTFANVNFVGNSGAGVDISGDPSDKTAPLFVDCEFRNNGGGAVHLSEDTEAEFRNVIFTTNYKDDGGGAASGGVLMEGNFSVLFEGCTFEGNSSGSGNGGAIQFWVNGDKITLVVYNCQFLANTNGAIDIQGYPEEPAIISFANCLFVGNTSNGNGGAMYFMGPHDLAISNCTFTGNESDDYGAAAYFFDGIPSITNSIFWGNTTGALGEEVNYYDNTSGEDYRPTFRNCDIAGSGGSTSWNASFGIDDGGNIDTDPFFVKSTSSSGDWSNLSTNDYGNSSLRTGSPAVDAGLTSLLLPDMPDLDDDSDTSESIPTDLAGNPRVNGTSVDMGAYEQ